ncbi:MAG: aspartate aminotransferase family protein [Acidimicrobiia bacterium]|nr:aspartate aminotransferase family protein [Acidimicrobiia bacterium]
MGDITEPRIPDTGIAPADILEHMRDMRANDADWHSGQTWSLVYHAGDEHAAFLKEAHGTFFSENALNPIAFPSLRRFETEVVRMTATMLNGDNNVAGTMTSGGSESILMAVKTYRDQARQLHPEIRRPEMVLPVTAHAAFLKAGHYFGVEPVLVRLADDLRVDVSAMRAEVGPNTILLVGSAPNYPHGIIDPIEEIGAIAHRNDLGFHVDACLGGFLLPWVEQLGHPIPPFDFRVPGVTSMSADVHKYGFAAKGASTILYRDVSLRRYQFHVSTGWPGGIYASPSMAGTRPGGTIAAAWAALKRIGRDGYLEMAQGIMETTARLLDGINRIPGLRILGKPPASVFAFASDEVDIYAVGDALDGRGWHMDRQIKPASLHLMITPVHAGLEDRFLDDLAAAVEEVRANPETSQGGQAALYGMMTTLPDQGLVDEIVLQMLDNLYEL